jgi:hypothetical protein
MMVLALENAALNAIRDFLDVSESAVGTAINICNEGPFGQMRHYHWRVGGERMSSS